LFTHHTSSSFRLLLRSPPTSTSFPYTTLFRSPLAKRRPARLKSQFGIAHTEVQAEAASRRRSILADRSLVLEITLLDGAAANRRSESTRLNSSHVKISYAVFCLKKKKN